MPCRSHPGTARCPRRGPSTPSRAGATLAQPDPSVRRDRDHPDGPRIGRAGIPRSQAPRLRGRCPPATSIPTVPGTGVGSGRRQILASRPIDDPDRRKTGRLDRGLVGHGADAGRARVARPCEGRVRVDVTARARPARSTRKRPPRDRRRSRARARTASTPSTPIMSTIPRRTLSVDKRRRRSRKPGRWGLVRVNARFVLATAFDCACSEGPYPARRKCGDRRAIRPGRPGRSENSPRSNDGSQTRSREGRFA